MDASCFCVLPVFQVKFWFLEWSSCFIQSTLTDYNQMQSWALSFPVRCCWFMYLFQNTAECRPCVFPQSLVSDVKEQLPASEAKGQKQMVTECFTVFRTPVCVIPLNIIFNPVVLIARSAAFHNFVKVSLTKNPKKRPTAEKLLSVIYPIVISDAWQMFMCLWHISNVWNNLVLSTVSHIYSQCVSSLLYRHCSFQMIPLVNLSLHH